MFNSLSKAIHFLRSNGNTTALVYDDMLGEKGLAQDLKTHIPSVNMGFWKDIDIISPDKIHTANQAMFRLVSEAARFSEHDEKVLDVGCGFATNMKYCLDNHKISKMIGLNISPFQTDWGNKFLFNEGLAHRAEVVLGSATDMPFENESICRMISIEAAFHFDTREVFLKEAIRVLKPGGILSMADLIICKPRNWWQRFFVKSIMKTLYVPSQNVYDYEEYVAMMHRCGLEILHIESMSKEVTSPFKKWFWKRPISVIMGYNFLWSVAGLGFMFAKLDYLRVVACKR
ncbi:MAG: methyltransferase domain-containing protein [Chitinophagaceae bacterium]|nr:methyltransferase domain-containing protein [Chitinophagaceae bacterium]